MKARTLLLFVMTVASASAQLYPGRLPLVPDASFHLGDFRYQFELKMTPDQVANIRGVLEKHAKEQQTHSENLASAKPDQYGAIQARLNALDKQTSQNLLEVLNGGQKARLRQLAVEEAGPFALRDRDVAASVGLTANQKASLEKIALSTIKTMDDINAKLGDEIVKIPSPDAKNAKAVRAYEAKKLAIVKRYDPKLQEAEAKGNAAVLKLLTPAQTKKWGEAKGKAFKFVEK